MFREMLADAPAVLSAAVPVTALHEGGFLNRRSARLDHEKLGKLLRDIPDIRTPCPSLSEWVESWEVVDRRVYTPLAADLLNLDFNDFVERAKAGAFGKHEFDRDDPQGAWWPWKRFKVFLGEGWSEIRIER